MLDIFDGIEEWVKEGKEFSLATVIYTWGSAPRTIGSAMAISKDEEIMGSVSGGCVEGAVIKEARSVLAKGDSKLLSFGVSNEDAWSVGLSCGGKLGVYLEKFLAFKEEYPDKEVWQALHHAVRENKGCVLIRHLNEEKEVPILISPDGKRIGTWGDDILTAEAVRAFGEHKSQTIEHPVEGKLFLQVFPKKDKLIIVGAAHITADLVELANMFDFETVVIDPRGIFTDKNRFNRPPDELHRKWPEEILEKNALDQYTYAVLLTHDPKIDDQALHILLKSYIAYIGALGSRKTHGRRVARLEKAGFQEEEINRVHGPIGVDINAKRPKEIALSIVAELIEVKNRYL